MQLFIASSFLRSCSPHQDWRESELAVRLQVSQVSENATVKKLQPSSLTACCTGICYSVLRSAEVLALWWFPFHCVPRHALKRCRKGGLIYPSSSAYQGSPPRPAGRRPHKQAFAHRSPHLNTWLRPPTLLHWEFFFHMAEIHSQIGPNSLCQRPTPTTGTGVSVPLIEAASGTSQGKLNFFPPFAAIQKTKGPAVLNPVRYVTLYSTEIRACSKRSKSKERLLSISKGFGSGLKMHSDTAPQCTSKQNYI